MSNQSLKSSKSVFLVGMMGAGKSYIGRALAKKLDRPFIDLDQLLEDRTGITIPEIFAEEGEAGFRKRESALLEEFLAVPGYVIATGGGVVTQAINREMLKKSESLIVYLTVTPTLCYRRTKGSSRPLLQSPDALNIITQLIEVRSPWYEEVADLTIESTDRRLEPILAEIAEALDQ